MTLCAGPDQCELVVVPLERRFVRTACRCSLCQFQAAAHTEVELSARCTRIILNGQVDLDLFARRNLIDIRVAGRIGCSIRNQVVDNRSGRRLCSRTAAVRAVRRTGSAVSHDQLDAVEFVRDIRHFVDAALRTHADALGVVLVQIDSIGCTV